MQCCVHSCRSKHTHATTNMILYKASMSSHGFGSLHLFFYCCIRLTLSYPTQFSTPTPPSAFAPLACSVVQDLLKIFETYLFIYFCGEDKHPRKNPTKWNILLIFGRCKNVQWNSSPSVQYNCSMPSSDIIALWFLLCCQWLTPNLRNIWVHMWTGSIKSNYL